MHPGYGFLSENPEFAEACLAEGLVWVGPPPAVMRQLGNKVSARAVAEAADVPVMPATGPLPDDPDAAIRIFTGGMVPEGAAAVIPRELVTEQSDAVTVGAEVTVRAGMHIRRQGENGMAGRVICCALSSPIAAAPTTFGAANTTHPGQPKSPMSSAGRNMPMHHVHEQARKRDRQRTVKAGMPTRVINIQATLPDIPAQAGIQS